MWCVYSGYCLRGPELGQGRGRGAPCPQCRLVPTFTTTTAQPLPLYNFLWSFSQLICQISRYIQVWCHNNHWKPRVSTFLLWTVVACVFIYCCMLHWCLLPMSCPEDIHHFQLTSCRSRDNLRLVWTIKCGLTCCQFSACFTLWEPGSWGSRGSQVTTTCSFYHCGHVNIY